MVNPSDFSENIPANSAAVKVKVPKRILHFSDGTIEEFSTDDEGDSPIKSQTQTAIVDPKTLRWGPWMTYMLWAAGSSTLAACDYVGESLASFFNITGPKYYFEIEEYKRREEEKRKAAEMRVGWSDGGDKVELCTVEPNGKADPTPV